MGLLHNAVDGVHGALAGAGRTAAALVRIDLIVQELLASNPGPTGYEPVALTN